MGRSAREKPKYLARKLSQIRAALALSQSEMLECLGPPKHLLPTSISRFERGVAEPPLPVLLRYAEVANVIVNVLIDDRLELPAQLPSPQRSEGIPRTPEKSPVKSAVKKTKP